MVVLARSLGIPARVVVGYGAGEIVDPGATTILLRERDAHAWAELLIDDRWQIYEPTPVVALPARAGALAAQPAAQPGAVPSIAVPRLDLVRGAAGTAALGLVALAAIVAWRWRPQRSIDRARRLLARAGWRRGVAWPTGATLREYAALLGPHLEHPATLDEAVQLLERAGYAGRTLSPAEEQRLLALVRKIW
jgi:transglutaminase-like putative cysteine protease